jgi:hypothetical protein
MRRLHVPLVAVTLLVAPAVQGQTAKEKDKAEGKSKPPARSFTDEDLKKYKEKRTDGSTETQSGAQPESTSPSSEAESAPRQRRSREYGGHQELPPPPPPSPKAQEPARVDSPPAPEPASPEEADWKARAKQARSPILQAEGRVKQIEAQIAQLRDRLNPMSTTYVLGGNSTSGVDAVYAIEEQLRTLDGELVGAKTAAAEAEKGWQSFLEEARAAGASPAWLNP